MFGGPNRGALRLAFAALLLSLSAAPQVAAEVVLRVVPQADLRNVDPHWTTAGITQNHGYMVYDTPFAVTADLEVKLQMLDSYEVSPDGMSYRFTLREGLTFHDGSPVQAQDVVASIKRWAARNAGGTALMERTRSFEATADLIFELELARGFGHVIQVLSNPTLPPFVMREEEAMTDPFTQIEKVIGSGPFVFERDKWEPGNKVFYRKFQGYKPRPEPVDGYAGGKVVNVDRVEWTYMPDANTATQALLAGEVDIFAAPSYDLIPLLEADPNVVVQVLDRVGRMGHLRPNHLHPPFDDPKARQALQLLIDQRQYLALMVGNSAFEQECYSIYMCGTPLETAAHAEPWRRPDPERAKRLLEEAGYAGEEVVIMQPTDFPIGAAIASLTAQNLRDAGLKVRVDAMDWSTLTSRRPKKDAPGSGPGWSLFGTWWTHVQFGSPLTNIPLASTCDGKNWFGWPCDEEMEALRTAFIETVDVSEQKRLAAAIQARYYETFPYFNTGQFLEPVAWRSNVVNVPRAITLQVWGLEKR